MVSVEEVPAMPDCIEEVRETTGTSARRYRQVVQQARAVAEQDHVTIQPHKGRFAIVTDVGGEMRWT
jgi:hypothetical protein